jgi:hypothetical protein
MGLRYDSLDHRTREFMAREFAMDVRDKRLYLSPRLTSRGVSDWPQLLQEALQTHDDLWLASELRARQLLNSTEQRRKQKGGVTAVQVPVTAADTLAEGEFNRFYARGVCARATEDGVAAVEVYRGKTVENPRATSEALIGRHMSAQALLQDLRVSQGVEPALHVPPGPNSGLTIRLTA